MVSTAKKADVWDSKTQTFHGGQEHRFLDNFIEDFSVTTNYMGTPVKALEAAKEAMVDIHHYPAANQEPAKTSLAHFLWPSDYAEHHPRLLMGNGASELIDLVVRKTLQERQAQGVNKPTWKGGPWNVQYQEYQRSAQTNGFEILAPRSTEPVDLLCIVNPCNPTGDYFDLASLQEHIRNNVLPGGAVIVDESMQPWLSREFRSDSLITAHDFVKEMWEKHQVGVHLMHSWTKIWCCTGLRVGSVVCPTVGHCEALRKIQVPWSVNGPALKFVEEVVKDTAFLEETWDNTPRLRVNVIDQLKALGHSEWVYHGKDFLSWVWIDMRSESMAEKAVELARAAGVPVRSGKPGYACPTFVRIAVRKEQETSHLINAWKAL